MERVQSNPIDGDTVEIYTNDGKWLARGVWSGSSQTRARIWELPDRAPRASHLPSLV
ncbi:hypothetical protein [Aeromonas taiwanensis]|uniref:hypothetical protein n=1 Tax=Aeromonas taiwanensis TaxID=633417 RepID=UPI0038B307B9